MSHPSHSPLPAGKNAAFRLGLSLGLTFLFVLVEVFAGLWSNSLALLTDAAHNFGDVLALGLSWFAIMIAARPAHARRTFGYHRVGVVVALFNAAGLIVLSLGILYEAWRRFAQPYTVEAFTLIGVGALAFALNLFTAWLVREGSQNDINMRSAFLHLIGDVFATLGAVLAGVAIFFTGWNWLDPLTSALISFFILWNAWLILRQAVSILIESTPEDIDVDALLADLQSMDGVRGVHDLHIWAVTENMRMLSAHIVTTDQPLSAGAGLQGDIRAMLQERYAIAHATLQLECAQCHEQGLYCAAC